MRTSTTTLTSSTLLLLSACAYDPEPGADEDMLARIEALEALVEEQADRIEELESSGITLLTESRTVTVNDVAELEAALDELDRYRLARDVTYTIVLEDGTYAFTSPIVLNHPDGDRLQIIGNADAPDLVTLTFDNDADGVVVEGGAALGLLEGVTVRAVNTSGGEVYPTGISVTDGGALTLGQGVVVEDFYYGVKAYLLSSITGPTSASTQWLTISGCIFGLMADFGSQVIADDYVNITPRDGGAGFSAMRGSVMHVNGGEVEGGYYGFVVGDGSTLIAEEAEATGQEFASLYVGEASYLSAQYATASGAYYGARIEGGAYAYLGYGELYGETVSIFQNKHGTVDVTGAGIPNGVSSNNNNITDFVIGN